MSKIEREVNGIKFLDIVHREPDPVVVSADDCNVGVSS